MAGPTPALFWRRARRADEHTLSNGRKDRGTQGASLPRARSRRRKESAGRAPPDTRWASAAACIAWEDGVATGRVRRAEARRRPCAGRGCGSGKMSRALRQWSRDASKLNSSIRTKLLSAAERSRIDRCRRQDSFDKRENPNPISNVQVRPALSPNPTVRVRSKRDSRFSLSEFTGGSRCPSG